MNTSEKAASYSDLQEGIDTLVGKFGMAKTTQMIRHLSGVENLAYSKTQRADLLYTFLIEQSSQVFKVPTGAGHKATTAYKDARMACYYLMNQHTDLKYRAIGGHYGQGKFAVYYHIKKCKELLSIPQFHKSFMERFAQLEVRTIEFLTKI